MQLKFLKLYRYFKAIFNMPISSLIHEKRNYDIFYKICIKSDNQNKMYLVHY